MSVAEALRAARSAGVDLRIDGQDLVLHASAPPAAAVLDLITRHKRAVIAFLRAGEQHWPAKEWRALFDERAAIAEFDGDLSRDEAEALAHACCVTEWLNRNPVHAWPDKCLECGGGAHAGEPLVPFGTATAGRAWLHHRCWDTWHSRRKAEATAALAALGIHDRSGRT